MKDDTEKIIVDAKVLVSGLRGDIVDLDKFTHMIFESLYIRNLELVRQVEKLESRLKEYEKHN